MNKNWKKILMVILLTLALIMMLAPSLFAAEMPASYSVKSDNVIKIEANTDGPGILPTNPFYFLVDWSRNLRRALTFSALSKMNYEMAVTDQKMVELQKMDEIAPENSAALATSLANYNDNLVRLRVGLSSLKDVSLDSTANKLFLNLIGEISRHQAIVEDLKTSHADLSDSLSGTLNLLSDILKQIPSSYFSVNKSSPTK